MGVNHLPYRKETMHEIETMMKNASGEDLLRMLMEAYAMGIGRNVKFLRALYDTCEDVVVGCDGRIKKQIDCHAHHGYVPALLFVRDDGYLLGAVAGFEREACKKHEGHWVYVVVAIAGGFLFLTWDDYEANLFTE